MPILGTLLVTLFGGLIEFLVHFFTKVVATRIALGALMVASFAILYAAGQALLSSIAMAVPTVLVDAMAMIFPSNTAACIAAMIAVDAVTAAFKVYLLGFGK